ncbi:Alpha/beta hydrolase family protein [Roseimaritima multifibrata]|uniref:Alpha/beta hydrolase family protein n=1 Tax=Roseimaritima multifibrata TaxID=1930274 RepID=A0A517MGP5_9BACT|nr:alpha/beta hydrolase [Roseimaritima multifibrata]QDS94053.1 Alpha/beta hydrolase family protein [Roseimaritima multifibrata]
MPNIHSSQTSIALVKERMDLVSGSSRLWIGFWTWVLVMATTTACFAQAPKKRPGEKEERPFQIVAIETKDGVRLRAAYFPSDKEKDAVPVLIVHEWGGQASPYLRLGLALKKAGCAVLIPELRGHGASNKYTTLSGGEEEFDLSKMGQADVALMLSRDLESCKGFLKEKNDAGELNLNALTLIGVKEGAALAAEWAIADWNFPSLGSKKQGQDVRAMIYVSPEELHKGVRLDKTFRDRFVWRLPTLIIAGKGSPEMGAANTVHDRLEKMRKKARMTDEEANKMFLANASLSGANLIQNDPAVTTEIVNFINSQVLTNILKFRWINRSE